MSLVIEDGKLLKDGAKMSSRTSNKTYWANLSPERRAEYIARNVERRKASRQASRDKKCSMHGLDKHARIDLGLALLQRLAIPGVPLTREEMAPWLGCTDAAIYQIEQGIFRKLRRVFARQGLDFDALNEFTKAA